MKKSIYLFALVALFSACKKMELTFPPDNQILAEDALQTPEDLQKFLNSCYDVMANTYNGNCQNLATLQADNVTTPNSHLDYLEVYNRNTIFFNGTVGGYYKQPYIAIYRSNYLLESVDLISEITASEKNRMTAEARFIRVLCHLDLVRLFAHPYGYTADNSHNGIIIKTSTNPDPKPRNTVQEVYDFMVAELSEITNQLPEGNGNYANKFAARALLAKIYFQMNEMDLALNETNAVIDGGAYTLDDDSLFIHRFRDEISQEAIFTIVSTSNFDNRSGQFTGSYRSDINANPTLRASDELYALATSFGAEEDLRSAWFEVKNVGAENEFVAINKFNKEYFNIPLLHLTEMYLTRAEVNARLGNISAAVTDVNMIIDRAYKTAAQMVDPSIGQEELLEIIERERRLELSFEGDRIHYLRRNGAFYNGDLLIRDVDWDCDGFLLQFPSTEQTAVFEPNPSGGC
jgi:hypothetical protein